MVATHNPGKAREIAALLDGRFELVAAGELGLPEPDETETTFVGNAAAEGPRTRPRPAGLIALADDSGLSVAALDGAPGIYLGALGRAGQGLRPGHGARSRSGSRRSGADDRSRLVHLARWPWPGRTGPAVVVEGRVDGDLTFPPRGDRGFGYDPIFVARGLRPDLRRDGAGRQGRHQPPRPGLRQAQGRAV